MRKVDRTLPKYTLGEELINAITHGVGALLSLIAMVVLLLLCESAVEVVSTVVYTVSLFCLYIGSTIYHALAPNGGKKVFRILDHCFIYVLIAGTYTPYCLLVIGGWLGITLLSLVWACSALGITLNAIDIKRFAVISMILYIGIGWVVVFAFRYLLQNLTSAELWLLIAGGIVYTLGACFYGIGSKVKYIHSVWHFFVLGGSILQFFSILLFMMR